MVLACSHSQDARTEFEILERSLKGGVKLVVHMAVSEIAQTRESIYAIMGNKLTLYSSHLVTVLRVIS